jgi:polysaccharide biosynthesis PFTS motif protein
MTKLKIRPETFFQKFIDQGGLRKIRNVKQLVIDLELRSFRKLNGNKFDSQIELAYIQKKISYLFNSKMYIKIVESSRNNRKCSLIIPSKWNASFNSQSIRINSFISSLKWVTFISLVIIKSITDGFINILKREDYKLNEFIVAEKSKGIQTVLLNSKFPIGEIFNGEPAIDFGNWYSSLNPRNSTISFIYFAKPSIEKKVVYHGKSITCKSFKSFNFGISFFSKIQLSIYAFKLLFQGILQSLGGNMATLVGYNELIFSKRLSFVQLNELPEKVLFSDNHGILMPIWVNQLVNSKVSVEYLFFSSYDSPSLHKDEDPRQDFWQLNSWPKMICVDQFQAEFMKKNIVYGNQVIEVGGFPYFSDNRDEIPSVKSFTISVFDFEPGINTIGISTISECGYNDHTINERFIFEIYRIALELNLVIFHKPKRRATLEGRTSRYKMFIDNLDSNHYIQVAPEVSPARIVQETNVTIGMPITTPGILANSYGHKAIFFDPLGKVMKKDPALRGIVVASNAIELKALLSDLIKTASENKTWR